MSNPQLIITGSIAVDRIMNYAGRFRDVIKPEKIHVLSLSVLLDKVEDTRGGIGANIAYNLALFKEKPILLGSVGQDASVYIENLQRMGINIDYLHFSPLPTATFNVFTDSEDNQIGGFYPGAMSDSARLSLEPWQNQDAFAVISAHDPAAMRRQVKEAKATGMRLFYDVGQQVINSPPEDLIAGVEAAELVVVNDYELATLCERTNLTLKDLTKTLKVLVVTNGKDGSIIYSGKEKPIEVGIAKPQQDVDPTGAGDGYRAGFLFGYLRGRSLAECGQMGAVAASYVVEQHGTQNHFFDADSFKQRYQATFGEDLRL